MIEGVPVLDLGATALLAVTVLMILTGRLVPKSVLDERTRERDLWQATAEKDRESLNKVLIHAELATTVFASIDAKAAQASIGGYAEEADHDEQSREKAGGG